MSYRKKRRLGFGVMLTIMILMGLIPSIITKQAISYGDAFRSDIDVLDLVINLQRTFWQASTDFSEVTEGYVDAFEPVIDQLDQALLISRLLISKTASETMANEIEHLKELAKQTKTLKVAVIHYQNEFHNDPTADNTDQLKQLALIAQKRNNEAFFQFMTDVFKTVKANQTSINQTMQSSQTISIVALLAGLLLGLFIAFYLGRALNRPVQRLVRGTQKLASGNLTFKIDDSDGDEIGYLASALNEMGAKLKAHLDEQVRLTQIAEKAIRSEKDKSNQLARINDRLMEEAINRQKAEKNYKDALKNTKMILESMPFGVVLVGRDKKIRLLNRSALELMGVESEKEVQGQICHQQICPAQIDNCPVIDLGQPVDSSEKILIHQDGTHIPILKTVLPITYYGEDVLLEAFMDISELKQIQEELKLAKTEAELANGAKTEFLSNMSHELRTPLNHIIGFSEMLIDQHFGELNETQMEYQNDILDSGTHLLSLINDILDLSKVEAGKMSLEVGPVALSTLLERSLTIVKEKAMKNGIQLQLDMDGIPETISADERKLRQVLYNLLSNAMKFTPDGGTVTLSAKKNGAQCVQISVSDTGAGIRSEDIDRIFMPFEQANNAKAGKTRGTGLGLPLSKQFIELHGGRIWVETDGEGCGTTFTIELPCSHH